MGVSDTISRWGCNLTCCAMLINYHAGAQGFAFATTPGDLNAWLNGQTDGWNSPCGGPNRWAVARYARQNGISLYYQGDKPGRNDFIVDNYLCANAPIILWVNNEGHY